MAESPQPQVIRRYLLGQLPEQERDTVATRIFDDDDTFALACEIETDLIDALARGELAGDEADAVRRFVDESGQSDRLRIARALARRKTIRGPVFVGAFLAVAAALMLMMSVAFFHYRSERLARQQEIATREAKQPVIFAFAVPAGVTRGAGGNVTRVSIPAGTEEVHIRVDLEPGYAAYDVILRGAGGVEVVRGTKAEVVVPAAALVRGRYEVEIRGTKPGQPSEALSYRYFAVE